MLLFPLGIDPRWVRREELEGPGIYYGPNPVNLPRSVVGFRLDGATEEYFLSGRPYPVSNARWTTWAGQSWPVLFPGGEDGDLVASAFFWLSGWQEETCLQRDTHGRFPHAASLQAAWGTEVRPAVDAYRERLAALLGEAGVTCQHRSWGGTSWAMCPTHDIDYLRKWRLGMIYRETVQYLLLNHRKDTVGGRIRRFARFLGDLVRPGDVYRRAIVRLFRETRMRGGTATFFLKAAAHGPEDVAYRLSDAFLIRIRRQWEAAGFEVGLHPGYHAYTHPDYMQAEREALGAPVSVRQHFLRYESPATPRLHERLGFRIDSTLGFAETAGFRNATCLPFLRFDVAANRTLTVWEMPLAAMDSALFNRRGLSTGEAVAETNRILAMCRRFGGVAVILWHGVLWDELDHAGWGTHFTETLDAAMRHDALIASLNGALSAWLTGAPWSGDTRLPEKE